MGINLCQCDKCGKLAKMEKSSNSFSIPDQWQNTEAGLLCPNCLNLWIKWKYQFLEH